MTCVQGVGGGSCICSVSHGRGHMGEGERVIWRDPREVQPVLTRNLGFLSASTCKLLLALSSLKYTTVISGGFCCRRIFGLQVMGLGNCRQNGCSITGALWLSCHIQNT